MKKVLKVLVSIICWLFVAAAACMTLIVFTGSSNNGVGNLFGFMPFAIQSESMSPTISKGDVVIGTKIDDYKKLEVGDIITFWKEIQEKKVLNTHRIVSIEYTDAKVPYIFKTKGDNNPQEDETLVYQEDLVAKYKTKFNGVGKAVDFLETQKGFFICILLPLLLFFLFQLYHFIKVIVSMNKGKPLSEEEEEELKKRAVEEYLREQNKSGDEAATAVEATEITEPEAPVEETEEVAEPDTQVTAEVAEPEAPAEAPAEVAEPDTQVTAEVAEPEAPAEAPAETAEPEAAAEEATTEE